MMSLGNREGAAQGHESKSEYLPGIRATTLRAMEEVRQ